MKIKKPFPQLFFMIIITAGCKENFEPPVIRQDIRALVVDGFLNNSSDTTFISLSRTKKLDEGVRNSQEKGAQLFIEDATGSTLYNFQELNDSGKYFVPGMNLDINNKYRLRIITSNGKQYLSDEVPVIKTPPIDSISFGKTDNHLAIYANTHDPQNKTLYYRWEYVETWKYQAAYFSGFIYQNGGLRERLPEEYVYECWKTQPSNQILLGSSTKLAEDIIYHQTIRSIDLDGIELSIKYFIYLRQYALTKEGFEYIENLKKVTEQTGSLFDAQPSQLAGNIHALNSPGETVLGYITATTQESKQLYITNAEVQPWNYNPSCAIFKVPVSEISGAFSQGGTIPLSLDGSFFSLNGVFATSRPCGDCTYFGGVTTMPPFWQ